LENGVTIEQVEHYWNVVIPRLEKEMVEESDPRKQVELYGLYEEVLRLIAPHNFMAFNMYLELDEDHNDPNDFAQLQLYLFL
jgi:hypothetical protein